VDTGGIAISVRDKVLEAIEGTIHLVRLIPTNRLEWRPDAKSDSASPPIDLGHLLGHLLDCAAGFCAVLHAAHPTELQDFKQLRGLVVNHSCAPDDAAQRLEHYSNCIARGFEFLSDDDLPREIPTTFVPEGETLLMLLLGNFEHLTNHKYQLFFYLKLLGIPVTSADLYRFRGNRES